MQEREKLCSTIPIHADANDSLTTAAYNKGAQLADEEWRSLASFYRRRETIQYCKRINELLVNLLKAGR